MDMKPTITKGLFIESIWEIKKQIEHDRKCAEAFKILLPNDYTSCYDNHWVIEQLIKVLKIHTDDYYGQSWIEYFIYDLDFGAKWTPEKVKIDGISSSLQNPYDLWELLELNKK